jgi:hypothetical protein
MRAGRYWSDVTPWPMRSVSLRPLMSGRPFSLTVTISRH